MHGVRVKSLTEDFDTATASGRLMLTLLSGFAAHEREVIRERSLAGAQRVAQSGGWLGGRLPFGYCQAGSQRQAGLILSEEPLPGVEVSAAEVIRRIFRMAAEERQSCRRIADYLNALGVPCTSNGVERHPASPSQSVARWRAGRVRNLLISTVYKGQHVYGKRSRNQKRAPIVRAVPGIVSEAVWQQAQATLQHNYRFGPRHCRHAYLLRGLVKCGLCGLTYIGMTVRGRSGRQESYYRCNGKHDTRGVYGAMGQRCPSKDVQAGWLEQAVWEEIEGMLRRPERVLARLRGRLAQEQKELAGQRVQLVRLRQALSEKGQGTRPSVEPVPEGTHHRGNAVERQMQQIAQEEDTLRGELSELSAYGWRGSGVKPRNWRRRAQPWKTLGARLQEPLSWEARRQLVESLVERVRVDTREQAQERIARITATYRFSASAAIRQGPAKAQRVGARIEDRAPRLELIISNGRRTSRQRVAMPATA
jgi:site-specific DNA recombinase